MTKDSPSTVTRLLARLDEGDLEAADALLPLVYDALHGIASRAMSGQRSDHTLQATALINEAWIKLSRSEGAGWEGRRHFLGVAARAMRSVLVDHARAKRVDKRSPPGAGLSLDHVLALYEDHSFDVVDLDDALRRLEGFDPQMARIVELRCFGGCTIEETAQVVGVSTATVKRDWKAAGVWFKSRWRSE